MKGIRPVKLVRVDGTERAPAADEIVVEEPLEIRVAEERITLTMRTPGDDAHLALGWLLAEGVITSRDDVGALAHCGRPGDEGYGNVLEVTPGAGAHLDLDALAGARRTLAVNAACGVCGRASIEDLLARVQPVPADHGVPAAHLERALAALSGAQKNFARTGGLHAAVVLGRDGTVLAAAEDVGRHNAVDKVVGALLAQGRVPARAGDTDAPALMAVSGRLGFEIVQKAAVARLATVVAVSAPSSLAVDLADAMGVTLVGFCRGARYNIYTHPARIEPLSP